MWRQFLITTRGSKTQAEPSSFTKLMKWGLEFGEGRAAGSCRAKFWKGGTRQKKRSSICVSLYQVLALAYVESNSTKLEKQKLGSCMLNNYQSSQNARTFSSSDQPEWKSSMIHLKILWTFT